MVFRGLRPRPPSRNPLPPNYLLPKIKRDIHPFIHLSFYLESLFQKKVDLITPSGLSPYLKNDILREIEYLEIT